MTESVKEYLELLRKREYRCERTESDINVTEQIHGKNPYEVAAIRYKAMLDCEKPVIFPDDIFGFNRSEKNYPYYIREDGEKIVFKDLGNITPDYASVIKRGFDDILAFIAAKDADGKSSFYSAVQSYISDTLVLSDSYRRAAEDAGNTRLAAALEKIPRKPAETFYEACLFMKIIIFSLRCVPCDHLTIGRFDQYMYDFFESDKRNGVTENMLFETLEKFFVSLNFDTDLYFGIQQGDNGQSVVLGGFDRDGNSVFNKLSELCMEASIELNLIDPKINLRVGKNTPPELYEMGTRLTKKGLGFPQYCNDDIVVPGLCALGYDLEDAIDYTVAACWEYIIPNCAADVPNIATFNFPLTVNRAITAHLSESESFEKLMDFTLGEIRAEAVRIMESHAFYGFGVSPMLSVYVDGCLEAGCDISENCAKYNCSGCHGAGIANAADALAAVGKTVFENMTVTREELLNALEVNFEGYHEIRSSLLASPKMGNNDDYVDSIAGKLMAAFSDTMNGKPNGRKNGFWRAGTGSAMEYIWSARSCPATADGRLASDPYGSSFSPAITTKLNGPLSVIQSFTKFDMKKIINGGPLTLEIHDTVFRNFQGEKKVAMLVRTFINLGGHQLQLNSVNRDRLLDAQAHSENYPNLIVRVWGWSGYFCELDREYQDHVIRRTEFMI